MPDFRVVVTWLLLTTACAPGGGVLVTQGGQAPGFEERLRAEAVAQAPAPEQRIRFNPAPEICDCPDFELWLTGHWRRVRLVLRALSEEAWLEALASIRERDALGELVTLIATGELDDDPVVVCPNGSWGLTMRVDLLDY